MSASGVDRLIDGVIGREGGYSNDASEIAERDPTQEEFVYGWELYRAFGAGLGP